MNIQMRKKLDCVGLGFSCVDFLIRIPRMPSFREQSFTPVLNFEIQGGGPVSTGLVAMSRLGAKVGYIGKVGDDQWGEFIRREFAKYGVDTSRLAINKGNRSNCSFVLIEAPTGERVFMVFPSDASSLELMEEDEDYIKNSRMLFLDGSGGQAIVNATKIAKENGLIIFIDGLALGELEGLVDIAICSEQMAYRAAATTDPEEALEKLYQEEYKILGITLGSRGSIFREGNKIYKQSAFKVKVIDTTGAGDVFHGAFAYGILQGWNLEKTAEFASAVSALKCMKLGGRAGIPSINEALVFLKEHGSKFF